MKYEIWLRDPYTYEWGLWHSECSKEQLQEFIAFATAKVKDGSDANAVFVLGPDDKLVYEYPTHH